MYITHGYDSHSTHAVSQELSCCVVALLFGGLKKTLHWKRWLEFRSTASIEAYWVQLNKGFQIPANEITMHKRIFYLSFHIMLFSFRYWANPRVTSFPIRFSHSALDFLSWSFSWELYIGVNWIMSQKEPVWREQKVIFVFGILSMFIRRPFQCVVWNADLIRVFGYPAVRVFFLSLERLIFEETALCYGIRREYVDVVSLTEDGWQGNSP